MEGMNSSTTKRAPTPKMMNESRYRRNPSDMRMAEIKMYRIPRPANENRNEPYLCATGGVENSRDAIAYPKTMR